MRSLAACVFFALAPMLAHAQQGPPPTPRDTTRKVLVVPGLRNGTSIFPLANYKEVQPITSGVMDFKHYHTSAEVEEWMRRWAKEHPQIVELYTVGQSFGGRDLLQLTLTNRKTGKDTDKPAAFFEGGRHSGEISSTESVLYLAWHLIENYGKDPAITKLLDEKAIYLRPLNNPDGSDMYRLTAQSNRSSIRPVDNDGDGLLDEDPGEDLDNDGHIRQMRKFVGAGKGNAVLDTADASKRLMRNVPMGQGDYLMYSEGADSDRDGQYNEDGVGGLDLHRNYPYNWRPMAEKTGRGNTQFGAGEYPLSEPETRAVYMWQLTHPNISVTNSMDTSVPMHLRGPSTCDEEECMFPVDRKLFLHFDTLGIRRTGYPWAGNVYRMYATRNAAPGQGRPEALFGHGPDFGYFQMGQIWYGDEIWNGGRERDYNKDGRWDNIEVLRYCDEEFGGKCFQPWTKVQHPDLGEVEIGGYNPKFFSQNGPPEVLEKWARNQAMFNLDLALAAPKVEIVDAVVASLRTSTDSATHEIKVTVRNTGLIPTALEQAKRVHIVKPDRVVLVAPPGSTVRTIGRETEFWLGGNETKTVTLRAKATAGATMTVRLLSTRGGVAEREVIVP
ncbi:MAG: peptidase [Cytophagaceae bacterium]|nr:peptidase [Gemmatimonadaceae bacterium]